MLFHINEEVIHHPKQEKICKKNDKINTKAQSDGFGSFVKHKLFCCFFKDEKKKNSYSAMKDNY